MKAFEVCWITVVIKREQKDRGTEQTGQGRPQACGIRCHSQIKQN